MFLDQSNASAQEQFLALDKDGDGSITTEELKEVRPGMTDTGIQNLILEEDADESGTLELQEFLNRVERQEQYKFGAQDVETQIRDAFYALDKNKDNFISSKDLKSFVTDAEEARQMILHYDIDGDGQINHEEFNEIMNSR